jgi:hypothetical protein
VASKIEFMKKFALVQRELKAPKSQYNKFGKYAYRNCEDILEGANKVLGELVITLSDDMQMVGDRIYVKATATVTDGDNSISNTAFARESLSKKGMDESQITGTASSYARKYALNGLLCIDDTKDADHESINKDTPASDIITATDKQWIAAVKADSKVLDTITDPKYKARIQQLTQESK